MHATPSIMSTRTLLLPALFSLLLLACGRQEAPVATSGTTSTAFDRTVTEVAAEDGQALSVADISIDGMSCEQMCGSSIRKALGKLPGVSLAEIRFIEGEVLDHAIVTYDHNRISDAVMVETIQGLHGGQYKVQAVDITRRVPSSTSATPARSERRSEEEKAVSVQNAGNGMVLPSLLGLLTRIMRL
jgi:periplasmic mercuric ion binding protein